MEGVPGNPWFICTLWVGLWCIATAKTRSDLRPALDTLRWAADHSMPSGVMAEQVDPFNNKPLSVSPLTWSHAAFVTMIHEYKKAFTRLR